MIAEDVLRKNNDSRYEYGEYYKIPFDAATSAMLEFARFHVKAALEAAAETTSSHSEKHSILKAYLPENIE